PVPEVRRWPFPTPTPAGWGTAAGSALLYAAGWWLGYPEPATFGIAGLAAVAGAALWTLPQVKLDVRREIAPTRVERREPAVGVLHVTNRGRGARGVSARDAAGTGSVTADVPRLRPGGTRTVAYRLPAVPRGAAPEVRLVRPRTVPLGLLPSGRAHHLDGPTSDRSPAGTATFHALREYVVGDELRHIHWKSSARTGTLMVRRLVDASLPTTTVV